MPRRRTTFETVRKLGLALPRVQEGTMYGAPALKLNGQLLACVPTHKSAEPDSLAVRIDFDQRDSLIADAPDTYYLKPHYLNYPCVLVRLKRIHSDALNELLKASWQFVNSRSRKRAGAVRSRRAVSRGSKRNA
ncbi:MAG TPA: MmcQ/YjbR family DNA-binding protein [Pyrinomonadaceae bacterium]|nr:MmcQ/YjbR family DNA-binding protein [Pyrinomonadaceae bacterium]